MYNFQHRDTYKYCGHRRIPMTILVSLKKPTDYKQTIKRLDLKVFGNETHKFEGFFTRICLKKIVTKWSDESVLTIGFNLCP